MSRTPKSSPLGNFEAIKADKFPVVEIVNTVKISPVEHPENGVHFSVQYGRDSSGHSTFSGMKVSNAGKSKVKVTVEGYRKTGKKSEEFDLGVGIPVYMLAGGSIGTNPEFATGNLFDFTDVVPGEESSKQEQKRGGDFTDQNTAITFGSNPYTFYCGAAFGKAGGRCYDFTVYGLSYGKFNKMPIRPEEDKRIPLYSYQRGRRNVNCLFLAAYFNEKNGKPDGTIGYAVMSISASGELYIYNTNPEHFHIMTFCGKKTFVEIEAQITEQFKSQSQSQSKAKTFEPKKIKIDIPLLEEINNSPHKGKGKGKEVDSVESEDEEGSVISGSGDAEAS